MESLKNLLRFNNKQMKILDRNKDYYDYLQGVYGTDNQVIFDRQKSVVLDVNCWDKIFDREYTPPKRYSSWLDDNNEFLILECGFTQYLLHLELLQNNTWNLSLKRIFRDNKHYKDEPLSIYFVRLPYTTWYWQYQSLSEYPFEKMNYANDLEENCTYLKRGYVQKYVDINLPILKNTGIPALIPAEDIWRDLYNYLLYKKEPQIVENRTDRQKLEGKGFDKTTSFRHPIK